MSDTLSGVDLALGRRSHDLVFDDEGNLMLVEGAERVSQQVKVTLLAFLGEYFLDIGFGVPYFTYILIKGASLSTVENVLRTRINNVPDLVKITQLTLDVNDTMRTLQVVWSGETELGVVNGSVLLNG